jgi:hypothetical protein
MTDLSNVNPPACETPVWATIRALVLLVALCLTGLCLSQSPDGNASRVQGCVSSVYYCARRTPYGAEDCHAWCPSPSTGERRPLDPR